MKRSRFDSEYERIRRKSGMDQGKQLAEFPEPDEPRVKASVSPEEQAIVAERLRLFVDEFTQRVTAQQEADREKIRAQAQEARDRTQRILADARRRNAEAYAESQDEQASG